MNPTKLFSPDFVLGKTFLLGRAVGGAMGLVVRRPSTRSWRVARLALQVTPRYTMVAPNRLAALYDIVQQANALELVGDIVECGTWHGGSAAIMAAACRDDDWLDRRSFWLFDSFQGLPAPGEQDGMNERRRFFPGWCTGDMARVQQIMVAHGVSPDRLHIGAGWFEQTLPTAAVEQIAALHIDVDWYASVKTVLHAFYDKVVPGGFIVFDDYGQWPGCRTAVQEFLQRVGVMDQAIVRPTKSSAYVRKPTTPNRSLSSRAP